MSEPCGDYILVRYGRHRFFDADGSEIPDNDPRYAELASVADDLLSGSLLPSSGGPYVSKYEHRGYGCCLMHGWWSGPQHCPKCVP